MAIPKISKAAASLLLSVCRRVLTMKGGPGIRVVNGPNGITISLDFSALPRPVESAPPKNLYRITAITTGFPANTYTLQRVISYNSSSAWPDCYVTDGEDVTGINGNENTPINSYPSTIGEGVNVANSGGAVATTFSGSTAGSCKMRAPKVGVVVYGTRFIDESGGATRVIFTFERSAQAD